MRCMPAVTTSLLLAVSASIGQDSKTPTIDQLLMSGRYSEIPTPADKDPHAQAVWAFAQYHLAPSRAVAQAAQAAHREGDDLGTFVLMLCQRTGTGLLRDQAEANKLNFDLRTKLEKKPQLTPVELYLLSRCQPGDQAGRVRDPDAEKLFAELNRQRKLAWERVSKAADLGFAQACQDVALAQQDRAEAHRWHRKAAELGLAEGLRYAGLQLILGAGVQKDAAKGQELSVQAANKGDVYAMVNLAVYYHQGQGGKQDNDEAARWLDKAAQSGHWYGCIERGMSFLTGDYGVKKNREQGVRVLQKALETGNGEALMYIATAYAQGAGLKQDGKQAVRFAEAAYRQGNAEAAAVLAKVYAEGIGPIKGDEDAAAFWAREASRYGFGVQFLGEKEKADFQKRLDSIDPFALKVE
jgi:TPR repeat protein